MPAEFETPGLDTIKQCATELLMTVQISPSRFPRAICPHLLVGL